MSLPLREQIIKLILEKGLQTHAIPSKGLSTQTLADSCAELNLKSDYLFAFGWHEGQYIVKRLRKDMVQESLNFQEANLPFSQVGVPIPSTEPGPQDPLTLPDLQIPPMTAEFKQAYKGWTEGLESSDLRPGLLERIRDRMIQAVTVSTSADMHADLNPTHPSSHWEGMTAEQMLNNLKGVIQTIRSKPAVRGQVAQLNHFYLAPARENRVYLAGPMSGIEDHNFPAFNQAAEMLRSRGYTVINPADHGHIEGAQWGDYLRYDIERLVTCECIALLPGWEKSRGATLEMKIATHLGLKPIVMDGAALPDPAQPYLSYYTTHPYTDPTEAEGAIDPGRLRDFSQRMAQEIQEWRQRALQAEGMLRKIHAMTTPPLTKESAP